MKTQRFARALAVVLAAVTAGLGGPSAVGAKPARPSVSLNDCYTHSVLVPIPRQEARGYVPEGFEPVAAPQGQDHVSNLYVTSIACGDLSSPTLAMVLTHLLVDPPADRSAGDVSHYYILDAGGQGQALTEMRQKLCLGSQVKKAQVTVSPDSVGPDGGPKLSTARSSVSSDFLSAESVVSTYDLSTGGGDNVRWFYGTSGTTYFDAFDATARWGVGSAGVVFKEPYRGLVGPRGWVGMSSVSDTTFFPGGGCSR